MRFEKRQGLLLQINNRDTKADKKLTSKIYSIKSQRESSKKTN